MSRSSTLKCCNIPITSLALVNNQLAIWIIYQDNNFQDMVVTASMSADKASEQTHADALNTASSSAVSLGSAPPPVLRRCFVRFEGN